MNKKKRTKLKQIKIRNRRLIKKYPWLLPRNVWTDKVPDDYDYLYIEWYEFPRGWNIAFGDMFLEELGEAVKEAGIERTFRIVEMKEKYGSLRCYTNGYTDKIKNVIDKYEHISTNVCVCCGKPDVPMINDGWFSPWCFDCFKKNYRQRESWIISNRKDDDKYTPKTEDEIYEIYEDCICDDDPVISDSYTIRRFSKDGNIDMIYDISKTANAIREKWEKHENNSRQKNSGA